MGIDGNATAIN